MIVRYNLNLPAAKAFADAAPAEGRTLAHRFAQALVDQFGTTVNVPSFYTGWKIRGCSVKFSIDGVYVTTEEYPFTYPEYLDGAFVSKITITESFMSYVREPGLFEVPDGAHAALDRYYIASGIADRDDTDDGAPEDDAATDAPEPTEPNLVLIYVDVAEPFSLTTSGPTLADVLFLRRLILAVDGDAEQYRDEIWSK